VGVGGVALTPAAAAAIIRRMNDLFEGDLTDADCLNFTNYVRAKLVENPVLRQQAQANSQERFALGEFGAALTKALIATLGNHRAMAEQVFADECKCANFGAILLDVVWDELRREPVASRESGERGGTGATEPRRGWGEWRATC